MYSTDLLHGGLFYGAQKKELPFCPKLAAFRTRINSVPLCMYQANGSILPSTYNNEQKYYLCTEYVKIINKQFAQIIMKNSHWKAIMTITGKISWKVVNQKNVNCI